MTYVEKVFKLYNAQSVEVALIEAQSRFGIEYDRAYNLDSKASFILTISGLLFGFMSFATIGNIFLVILTLVILLITIILMLCALWLRKYHYITTDGSAHMNMGKWNRSDLLQFKLLCNYAYQISENSKINNGKATLIKYGSWCLVFAMILVIINLLISINWGG